MTTITVGAGSVAIIPLTVAEGRDISVDKDAVLIVWDDEDDSISSVRQEMGMALRNQAVRLEVARAMGPQLASPVGAEEAEVPPLPVYGGPRPAGSEPRDALKVPVYTQKGERE